MLRNLRSFLSLAAVSLLAFQAHATETSAVVKPRAHCNWGDIGCTNPPPKAAALNPFALKPAGAAPAAPQAGRLAGAGQPRAACDKGLSTGDECWTNCKTEDDITICDIIKLDTFWPEAPGGDAKVGAFTGRTIQKTVGNRKVVGRLMK